MSASRAEHDVAKYAALTARNLPVPPWDARLMDAVARDVLQTDGRRPVWEVWADRRADLADIAVDLDDVDRRIDSIRSREAEIRAPGRPGVDEALVADLRALVRAMRDLRARVH